MTKPTSLRDLLSRTVMSRKETHASLKILAGQLLTLMENQKALQAQNAESLGRIERLYEIIFDKDDGDGGVKRGLAFSFSSATRTLRTHEAKFSALMVGHQALRRTIPWIFEFFSANGRLPSMEEVNAQYEDVVEELEVMGEGARVAQPVADRIAKEMFRCSGCVFWTASSGLELPDGVASTGERCQKKMVQVRCPACATVYPLPVDPNNISASCGKCQTPLVREVVDGEMAATLCLSYQVRRDALRGQLIEEGVHPTIAEAFLPPESV